jgi:hypothetical protein
LRPGLTGYRKRERRQYSRIRPYHISRAANRAATGRIGPQPRNQETTMISSSNPINGIDPEIIDDNSEKIIDQADERIPTEIIEPTSESEIINDK